MAGPYLDCVHFVRTCRLYRGPSFNSLPGQSRALCLSLVTRSQYVSTVLCDLEHRAQLGGFTYGKLEELAANRHKYYGPGHLWTWIHPYLDPAKLHVYLDCYPGLSEMKIGLYPRA